MEKEMFFKVRLREIPEGGLTLEDPIPTSWLAEVLENTSLEPGKPKGAVHLRIDPVGTRQYLVSGSVEVNVVAACVSCLAETSFPVRSEVKLLVENDPPRAQAEAVEDEDDAEDSESVLITGEVMVLDDILRDSLLLEMPMSPKCRPDCDGWRKLLPRDEKPGMDPRLTPLARARDPKEG